MSATPLPLAEIIMPSDPAMSNHESVRSSCSTGSTFRDPSDFVGAEQ